MKVLITGAAGFVGRHVATELRNAGHQPIHFDRIPIEGEGSSYTGDLLDRDTLTACIAKEEPDACIHLAGIAFVPIAWEDPARVIEINVTGTLNLLESFRATRADARILAVTSAEVYGREARPEPVRESDPLIPSNLYAVSKIGADTGALLYHRHYGLPVMTARPQNHIGPGQSHLFVVSAFVEQLLALRHAPEPHVMRVGNLASRRDFTDVRDVARAYRLLIEKGQPGEAYNIASGRVVPIQELLDHLCRHAGLSPRIEVDPALYRATDQPPLLDIAKIENQTGWHPEIALEQTLAHLFDQLAGQPTPAP